MKQGEKHSAKTASPPLQKDAERAVDEQCIEENEKLEKEISSQDEEIMKLNKEIETLKDLLQRRQADFENFRKRTVKMQEEYKKLAIKDFAYDILDISDDLARAVEASNSIASAESSSAGESLAEGVKIISRRLEETLNKFGISEIESENRSFDPNYHEAIEIETSPDVKSDTVTKVYRKGFKLDEYVIRAAKVRVAKPAPETDADSRDGSNDQGEQHA